MLSDLPAGLVHAHHGPGAGGARQHEAKWARRATKIEQGKEKVRCGLTGQQADQGKG
mgnify:CR=1 FL=1